MADEQKKKLGRPLSIPEPELRILNQNDIPITTSKSAVEVSKDLQKLMLRMKGEFIAQDGSGVNYEKLKSSKIFEQYKKQAAQLRVTDIGKLEEDEKMAFFINIYNALMIHGLADCDPIPDSVLKVQQFWKVTAYNISGYVFSLDDIEHGILRTNRPHPSSQDPLISPGDPRLKFVMKKRDPRIHFALVCGAKSCPAIQVYTAGNLNHALDSAARSFCEQEIKVFEKQQEVHISKIFQWYRCDFGENDIEALRWTFPYLTEEKRKSLDKLLVCLDEMGGVDLYYAEYNWMLNGM